MGPDIGLVQFSQLTWMGMAAPTLQRLMSVPTISRSFLIIVMVLFRRQFIIEPGMVRLQSSQLTWIATETKTWPWSIIDPKMSQSFGIMVTEHFRQR